MFESWWGHHESKGSGLQFGTFFCATHFPHLWNPFRRSIRDGFILSHIGVGGTHPVSVLSALTTADAGSNFLGVASGLD